MVTPRTEPRPGTLRTVLGIAALALAVAALAASLLDAPAAGSVRAYDDQRPPLPRAARLDGDIAEAPGCPVEHQASRMGEMEAETC